MILPRWLSPRAWLLAALIVVAAVAVRVRNFVRTLVHHFNRGNP